MSERYFDNVKEKIRIIGRYGNWVYSEFTKRWDIETRHSLLSTISWRLGGWEILKHFKLNISVTVSWHFAIFYQKISHKFYLKSVFLCWGNFLHTERFSPILNSTWFSISVTFQIAYNGHMMGFHFSHNLFPSPQYVLFLLASYCWWKTKNLKLSQVLCCTSATG